MNIYKLMNVKTQEIYSSKFILHVLKPEFTTYYCELGGGEDSIKYQKKLYILPDVWYNLTDNILHKILSVM